MDAFRHAFAVIWLVAQPLPVVWLALHGWIGFWRRLGPVLTYLVLVAGLAGAGLLLFMWRGPLLAVEFGTHPVLWVAAGLLYLASLSVEVRARRHLRPRTLLGLPELLDESGDDTLLREGIYRRIRHPRYVGAVLAYLASALFANHLLLYAAAPMFLFLLHSAVLLEEGELVDRFGERYRAYMRRVPRYLPRRRTT